MNSILYTSLMAIIWFFNLFNNTGLGATYHTTEIARWIVYGMVIAVMLVRYKKVGKFRINRRYFYTFGLFALFFVTVVFFHGYGMSSLNYLWAYLLIFLIGKVSVEEKTMRLTSLCFGFLGGFVLVVYNYGNILAGWNSNTIGMLGFNSFLVFLIPYFKTDKTRDKIFLTAVATGYSFLIYPTDSRSCILFATVGILFALSIIPEVMLTGERNIIFWLLVPLSISIIVVLVSPTAIAYQLNLWSLEYFQKPFFNGRDHIWQYGFQSLSQHMITGTGNLNGGYWHNSAITCLTAFGVIGFCLWIHSLKAILIQGMNYKQDSIVIGSMVAFLLIYIQQSVELGLLALNPNLMPYMMLGILIGRIKYLNEKRVDS